MAGEKKLPRGVLRRRPESPGAVTTYLSGDRTVYVLGYENGVSVRLGTRTEAVAVQAAVEFWHAAQPDWEISRLLRHALQERNWAIVAQRKRRFTRVFS